MARKSTKLSVIHGVISVVIPAAVGNAAAERIAGYTDFTDTLAEFDATIRRTCQSPDRLATGTRGDQPVQAGGQAERIGE
ncbi:MAG TPA: hypothetical protein VFN77_01630 [Acetobacteraceae bacterium]|nr:hypothetical protein [Acetobacteraceae bacterium]